jgi:hypothetical protein
MASAPASTVSTPQPRGEANIAKTTPAAAAIAAPPPGPGWSGSPEGRELAAAAVASSWVAWRLISVQQPRPTLGDLQRATPWVGCGAKSVSTMRRLCTLLRSAGAKYFE